MVVLHGCVSGVELWVKRLSTVLRVKIRRYALLTSGPMPELPQQCIPHIQLSEGSQSTFVALLRVQSVGRAGQRALGRGPFRRSRISRVRLVRCMKRDAGNPVADDRLAHAEVKRLR